jgi:heat shock protein HtpX
MSTTYTHIAANRRKSLLLVAFFVVIILAVGWVVDQLSEAGTSFFVLALIIAIFMTLFSYFSGDKMVLWTSGARRINREDNPYLYRIVENLCITAGLPVPRIHIIPDQAINAFATGRDPKHASIAVTTGAIERLENEELEGVIAHELSHVGNYDIRFMMLISVMVGLIALLSDMFVRSMWFGGGRRESGDNRSGNAVLAIVGLIFIVLSPIIAQIIQLAVSRRREFLADASGALLTRYPKGLANALRKIAAQGRPVRKVSNATAPLYFANPLGRIGRGLSTLFSTHPPVEERIKALEVMAGSGGTTYDGV